MAVVIPLSNSKVVLIVITILVIIFVVNIVIPPAFEEMQCGLSDRRWDSSFNACEYEPQSCIDAGGISKILTRDCGDFEFCEQNTVSMSICNFG